MSIVEKSTSILKRDAFLYAARMLASIIIARKLGPEALGIYLILQMIPSYAESFGRIKFDIAAIYFLGMQKYVMGEVVRTLNILAIVSSTLIVAVFLWQFEWLYKFLFSKTEYDAVALMYFMMMQVPAHFLFMNYSYLLIYREDIRVYNQMIVTQALVSSILPVILLLLTDIGIWGVVGSMLVGTILSLVVGVNGLGRINSCEKWMNFLLMGDLFRYGLQLYIASLLGHFQSHVTNLIAVMYLPPAQVAFFTMARSIGQIIDRVPAALNAVLFSRLIKTSDRDEAVGLTARAFRQLLLVMTLLGTLALLLIKPVIHFMYGDNFIPLIFPLVILIPGIIISGATTPMMQYFISSDRVGFSVSMPIIPLLIQILLALFLIPLWGPEGAAFALCASSMLLSIVLVTMFLHLTECSLKRDLIVNYNDIENLKNYIQAEMRKALKLMPFFKL